VNWKAHWQEKEYNIDKNDFSFQGPQGKVKIDYAYIIIHGTPGEDGKLQGYFDMLEIPYNTGNALNMAVTFNKGATQRSLKLAGIQISDFIHLRKDHPIRDAFIIQQVGLPCFVKPAEAGSSLGASKVKEAHELRPALRKVFEVDDEAMIERYLVGKELTCGVISYKGEVRALPITEVISKNEFFDYEAKYNSDATEEVTPALISADATSRIQKLAVDIFHLLNCRGVVRIDFFLCKDEIFVVEINTVPGFSIQSIVPKQLSVEGIAIKDLLMDIITTSTISK
jgi:D-alanine-D-alanine ligase